MSKVQRIALIVLTVAVVAVAFAITNPEDDEGDDRHVETSTAENPTGEGAVPKPRDPDAFPVRVRDGAPMGGVKEISVKKGDLVRLEVTSDSTDDVHVHGYDISTLASANRSARLNFTASIEGIFEIELEQSGIEIARLEVRP